MQKISCSLPEEGSVEKTKYTMLVGISEENMKYLEATKADGTVEENLDAILVDYMRMEIEMEGGVGE